MKYHELAYESVGATLAEIASGDPARVVEAILGAALECPDRLWVESCAIALTLSPDLGVRRAGLLTLGHLARRFRELDMAAVRTATARLESDPQLAGTLSDLADDLAVFGLA